MSVEEAVQTLKDLSGSFNVVCYEGGAMVLEDAVLVLLTAYESQEADSQMLDWLNSIVPERCLSIEGRPKIGMMKDHRWLVHLNGIGYVGRTGSEEPDVRTILRNAMAEFPTAALSGSENTTP